MQECSYQDVYNSKIREKSQMYVTNNMDKFISKQSYKEIRYGREHGQTTARGENMDASQNYSVEKKEQVIKEDSMNPFE